MRENSDSEGDDTRRDYINDVDVDRSGGSQTNNTDGISASRPSFTLINHRHPSMSSHPLFLLFLHTHEAFLRPVEWLGDRTGMLSVMLHMLLSKYLHCHRAAQMQSTDLHQQRGMNQHKGTNQNHPTSDHPPPLTTTTTTAMTTTATTRYPDNEEFLSLFTALISYLLTTQLDTNDAASGSLLEGGGILRFWLMDCLATFLTSQSPSLPTPSSSSSSSSSSLKTNRRQQHTAAQLVVNVLSQLPPKAIVQSIRSSSSSPSALSLSASSVISNHNQTHPQPQQPPPEGIVESLDGEVMEGVSTQGSAKEGSTKGGGTKRETTKGGGTKRETTKGGGTTRGTTKGASAKGDDDATNNPTASSNHPVTTATSSTISKATTKSSPSHNTPMEPSHNTPIDDLNLWIGLTRAVNSLLTLTHSLLSLSHVQSNTLSLHEERENGFDGVDSDEDDGGDRGGCRGTDAPSGNNNSSGNNNNNGYYYGNSSSRDTVYDMDNHHGDEVAVSMDIWLTLALGLCAILDVLLHWHEENIDDDEEGDRVGGYDMSVDSDVDRIESVLSLLLHTALPRNVSTQGENPLSYHPSVNTTTTKSNTPTTTTSTTTATKMTCTATATASAIATATHVSERLALVLESKHAFGVALFRLHLALGQGLGLAFAQQHGLGIGLGPLLGQGPGPGLGPDIRSSSGVCGIGMGKWLLRQLSQRCGDVVVNGAQGLHVLSARMMMYLLMTQGGGDGRREGESEVGREGGRGKIGGSEGLKGGEGTAGVGKEKKVEEEEVEDMPMAQRWLVRVRKAHKIGNDRVNATTHDNNNTNASANSPHTDRSSLSAQGQGLGPPSPSHTPSSIPLGAMDLGQGLRSGQEPGSAPGQGLAVARRVRIQARRHASLTQPNSLLSLGHHHHPHHNHPHQSHNQSQSHGSVGIESAGVLPTLPLGVSRDTSSASHPLPLPPGDDTFGHTHSYDNRGGLDTGIGMRVGMWMGNNNSLSNGSRLSSGGIPSNGQTLREMLMSLPRDDVVGMTWPASGVLVDLMGETQNEDGLDTLPLLPLPAPTQLPSPQPSAHPQPLAAAAAAAATSSSSSSSPPPSSSSSSTRQKSSLDLNSHPDLPAATKKKPRTDSQPQSQTQPQLEPQPQSHSQLPLHQPHTTDGQVKASVVMVEGSGEGNYWFDDADASGSGSAGGNAGGAGSVVTNNVHSHHRIEMSIVPDDDDGDGDGDMNQTTNTSAQQQGLGQGQQQGTTPMLVEGDKWSDSDIFKKFGAGF